MDEFPDEYHTALRLLVPLWNGIPGDYKQRYARNIWQQFEDNIRAAAYTAKLSKFVNSICLRLRIEITGRDVTAVNAVLASADERDILRQLREEATVLMLMVRMENEKQRAERKKRMANNFDFGLFEEGEA